MPCCARTCTDWNSIQRCTQIAAFALALTAWKFTDGFRPLPPLNIACSGLGVNARKEDWLALANGDTRLRSGLEQLYDLFQKAPELGSLINPRRLAHGDLVTASFAEIQPLLTKALQSEKAKRNDDLNEIGVAAQGMASAARAAGVSNISLVITNVPYLGRGKQSEAVARISVSTRSEMRKRTWRQSSFERCIDFLLCSGCTAAWSLLRTGCSSALTRTSRTACCTGCHWNFVARLGSRSFRDHQRRGC